MLISLPIKKIILENDSSGTKVKTFKFLNGVQLEQLLCLMEDWYFNNLPLTKRTKKYDKVIKRILQELDPDKLPKKLYRGISFETVI